LSTLSYRGDSGAVAGLSADYVNAVRQEITNIYGSNNIGVITFNLRIFNLRVKIDTDSHGKRKFLIEIAILSSIFVDSHGKRKFLIEIAILSSIFVDLMILAVRSFWFQSLS